jgi:hypothetical protein
LLELANRLIKVADQIHDDAQRELEGKDYEMERMEKENGQRVNDLRETIEEN